MMNCHVTKSTNFKNSWRYLQQKTEDTSKLAWKDSLEVVGRVNNINEFVYTLDELSEISVENLDDVYFFKGNTLPVAEEAENIEGGRIILEEPKSSQLLTDIVKKTLTFCILEKYKDIVGIAFNEKSSCFRICLWISNPKEKESILSDWKSVIHNDDNNHISSSSLKPFSSFTYSPHKNYDIPFSQSGYNNNFLKSSSSTNKNFK